MSVGVAGQPLVGSRVFLAMGPTGTYGVDRNESRGLCPHFPHARWAPRVFNKCCDELRLCTPRINIDGSSYRLSVILRRKAAPNEVTAHELSSHAFFAYPSVYESVFPLDFCTAHHIYGMHGGKVMHSAAFISSLQIILKDKHPGIIGNVPHLKVTVACCLKCANSSNPMECNLSKSRLVF